MVILSLFCFFTLMKLYWKTLQWQSSFELDWLELQGICDDTRLLKEGNAFFAYDGLQHQASDFCFEALQKKASAVFIDNKHKNQITENLLFKKHLPIFFGNNFLQQAGRTMQAITQVASQEISVVGVTGTNGKTTIANCIFQMYAPYASYLGTIGQKISSFPVQEKNLTTPSAAHIHNFLFQSAQHKVKIATLECSSHGIVQGRVEGIDWQFLIFTNLSQDHLDFHQNMEEYFLAKRQLFLQAIHAKQKLMPIFFINTDDSFGKRLYNELKENEGKQDNWYQVFDYGFFAQHYQIVSHLPHKNGYQFSLKIDGKEHLFQTRFLGTFNVSNLTAVIALAHFHEKIQTLQQWNELKERIYKLTPVSGRMEVLTKANFSVVVDYAHTPDALQKAIQTIAQIKPNRIICVFGCGGDRDTKKRPLMGKVAEQFADIVIITNDNPRTEPPEQIAQDIVLGMQNSHRAKIILDREQAIVHALQNAQKDDFILVAGKGHEQYQIFGKEKVYFSDQAVIQNWKPK